MAFGLVFLFTEIGEQLESRSDEIDEAVNELDWNTFPLRAQRMMLIMIVTTQNPIQVTAFGGIPCTRETFKKVLFRIEKKFILNFQGMQESIYQIL